MRTVAKMEYETKVELRFHGCGNIEQDFEREVFWHPWRMKTINDTLSLSKDTVQKLLVKFVPKNAKNTNWAVKNFTEWRDYHNSNSENQCPENFWK